MEVGSPNKMAHVAVLPPQNHSESKFWFQNNAMKQMLSLLVFGVGMLNSNFFQNRNSVPKNRVKIETRILPVQ